MVAKNGGLKRTTSWWVVLVLLLSMKKLRRMTFALQAMFSTSPRLWSGARFGSWRICPFRRNLWEGNAKVSDTQNGGKNAIQGKNSRLSFIFEDRIPSCWKSESLHVRESCRRLEALPHCGRDVPKFVGPLAGTILPCTIALVDSLEETMVREIHQFVLGRW